MRSLLLRTSSADTPKTNASMYRVIIYTPQWLCGAVGLCACVRYVHRKGKRQAQKKRKHDDIAQEFRCSTYFVDGRRAVVAGYILIVVVCCGFFYESRIHCAATTMIRCGVGRRIVFQVCFDGTFQTQFDSCVRTHFGK